MEPLTGVSIISPCLLPNHWKVASDIWVETIKNFCSNFDFMDAPWEYLERSNSSIFAGALTSSGVPSMPETYVMRDGRAEQQQQRVDICSVYKDKSIELIEFKMAEYDAIYPQTLKRINIKEKSTTSQVNSIAGIHGKGININNLRVRRTIAVLGLPYFEPGTNKAKMEDAIQVMISEIQNSNFDIKAWVFPSEYLVSPSSRYGNKFYVGTFLVAKNI